MLDTDALRVLQHTHRAAPMTETVATGSLPTERKSFEPSSLAVSRERGSAVAAAPPDAPSTLTSNTRTAASAATAADVALAAILTLRWPREVWISELLQKSVSIIFSRKWMKMRRPLASGLQRRVRGIPAVWAAWWRLRTHASAHLAVLLHGVSSHHSSLRGTVCSGSSSTGHPSW